MIVSKNAQCPCGSGLKYKRCCMLREGAVKLPTIPWAKIIGITVTSIGAGILVGHLKSPPIGVAATFATAMAIVCWAWLFQPPSSVRGRENSAAINFGHKTERTPKTRVERPQGPKAPPRRRGKRR